MVRGVGEVLRLEGHAGVAHGQVETVVDLHARLGGPHLDLAAGHERGENAGGRELVAGRLAEHPVHVVAGAVLELVVVPVVHVADRVGRAEVERRAGDVAELAGGDHGGAVGGDHVGVHVELVAHDRIAGVGAVEVPVGVVGEGDRRGLVGRRLPAEVPHVVVVEGDRGTHGHVAGVAALAVGRGDFQHEAHLVRVVDFLQHGPVAEREAAEAAVQGAGNAGRFVVELKRVLLAVERELARADAVAVAAHERAVVGAAVLGDVLVERRPAERDVLEMAVAVRDDRLDESAAEVGELELKAVRVHEAPQAHLFAVKRAPGHGFDRVFHVSLLMVAKKSTQDYSTSARDCGKLCDVFHEPL